MEVVMIAGLTVVAVGGFYSALDFLTDMGIGARRRQSEVKKSPFYSRGVLTPQGRIKKMAGMYI